MEKNTKMKFLKVLLCGVIAVAALCALAIPAAAATYPSGTTNFYTSDMGWKQIKFGVNGNFEVFAVPFIAYPNGGDQTLYDSNGVMLVCSMTSSSWLEFTIINNNQSTVAVSLTISTNGYVAVPTSYSWEEGFTYSSDNVPAAGVLSYKTMYISANTEVSNQGWGEHVALLSTDINSNTFSLGSLAQRNDLNGYPQSTASGINAQFSMVNNMPSRVYWRFRLHAGYGDRDETKLLFAVPKIFPYDPNVTVQGVSFSTVGSFLNDTVGSFFSFPILPGITIGGIFAVLLATVVVVIFLKMFAGG